MDSQTVLRDTEDRMKKSLDIVFQSFSSIRSGRASAGMVENIKIDYYGAMTPLKQMANITIPEPRMILIHPWDVSALKFVEKGIADSDLGIAPVIDGKMVRLVVPPLTRERREELIKIVHQCAEDGRVSMRAVRRDANEKVKTLEKDKMLTEDDGFKSQDAVQKLTDKYIQMIDQALAAKEKELLN